jgi:hypothetical protein
LFSSIYMVGWKMICLIIIVSPFLLSCKVLIPDQETLDEFLDFVFEVLAAAVRPLVIFREPS